MVTLASILEYLLVTCAIASAAATPERWKPAEPYPPPDITIGISNRPAATTVVKPASFKISSRTTTSSCDSPPKSKESESGNSITIEVETSLSWQAKNNATIDPKDSAIATSKRKEPGSSNRFLGSAKFSTDTFEDDIESDKDKLRWVVFARVGPGTEARKIRLLLDTGSSDTWAYSKLLGIADRVKLSNLGMNAYLCPRQVEKSFLITYRGGKTVRGFRYQDRFRLPLDGPQGTGGTSRGSTDIPDLGIGCVSDFTNTLEPSWEGILALGLPHGDSNTFIPKASTRNNYKRIFTLDFYDNEKHRGWNPSMKKSTWTIGDCTCKNPVDTSYIHLRDKPRASTSTFTTTIMPTITVETTTDTATATIATITTHTSEPLGAIQRYLGPISGQYDPSSQKWWFPCNKANGGPYWNDPPDLWVEVRSYNGKGATSGPAKNPQHRVRIPGKYLATKNGRLKANRSRSKQYPDWCFPRVKQIPNGKVQLYGVQFLLAYKTCFDQTRKIMVFCGKE